MLLLWGALPAFLLAFAAPSSAGASFENTAIVRTVELGGAVVHTSTTYAAKALEPQVGVYTVALSREERRKTSWIQAQLKGRYDALELVEHPIDANSQYHLIDIVLPEPAEEGKTVNIVFDTVQTHTTYPWPDSATQTDSQALKWHTELFVLSPFATAVQRTKIRSTNPQFISYTMPEGLDTKFATDSIVTKSGATITYGPFNNIPVSADADFIVTNQQPLTIHYKYDYPVMEVTKLRRAAEISHWGANLNIQDEMTLHNAGPKLKGHFSRITHQQTVLFQRGVAHVIPALTLHLPAGIHDVYYYDQIGNVSTSHLRTAPSVPRFSTKRNTQYSVFEMQPRYPILGGWNYSFTLGWDSPLADSASYDAKSGKYIVEVPVMTLLPGAVVDEAEVSIVLPEGASNVEYQLPFPAESVEMTTHKTYLDSIGRPMLTFHYTDLTDQQARPIFVSYKVSFAAHLQKPLTVATAFLLLFASAMIAKRVDLSIEKKPKAP
ncbi:oligosaccharyl transferase alpha subunit [Fistulina hepatica ATCC 64428]|nr:oligosaccharyl transferase alpha subunit [Fistulina hepatica ATCC 64428]